MSRSSVCFFSSRRRHTRLQGDWSSDVCSSDLLKGFRPGKAPFAVVRKQFGERVHAEVVGDLLRSSLAQALSQEKLRPAGGPRRSEERRVGEEGRSRWSPYH